MKSHRTNTLSLHLNYIMYNMNLRKSTALEIMSKRTEHHELRGGKLSRITQNAAKLSAVLDEHGNPFQSNAEDEIYNLTKAVMIKTSANDIVKSDEIGQLFF